MNQKTVTNMSSLLELYDVILLDAFGVLVTLKETLPFAKELIDTLNNKNKDYLIVTNNASSPAKQISESFFHKNLEIPEEKILSSGSLISGWIAENFEKPPKCLFMGGEKAELLLKDFTGTKKKLEDISWDLDEHFDLLVLCTQVDEDYKLNLEKLMSYLFAAKESGHFPKLLLPNPDLIYPKGKGHYGIVSGMIAEVLESALKLRFGYLPGKFIKLGKPSSYIFEKAKERFPGKKLLMIGDQLETDVKGARAAGIDSALILGGVVSEKNLSEGSGNCLPDFLLKDLKLN